MLDTTTEVEQIASVENEAGDKVKPASDDFRHLHGEVDVSEGYTVTVECPDRASTVTLHADGWTAPGEAAIHFLDPEGERLTTRDSGDNAAFGTDGSTDIFVEVSVASPFIEIELSGSETVTMNVYIR